MRGIRLMLQTLSTRKLHTDIGDLDISSKRSLDNLEVAKSELKIMSLETKRSELNPDEDNNLGSHGERALIKLEMAQREIENIFKCNDLDS